MPVPPRSRSSRLKRSLRGVVSRGIAPGKPAVADHARRWPVEGAEEPRSLAVSYLLWAALGIGLCGMHRFYTRRPLTGLLWLFTFGLCGVGQLVDLFLMPDLVKQANQRVLLEDALAALARTERDEMATSLERQLLLLARSAGSQGFTLNDALVDLQLPRSVDSAMVRAEIERLLQAELLDVGNDERGRVIYREP